MDVNIKTVRNSWGDIDFGFWDQGPNADSPQYKFEQEDDHDDPGTRVPNESEAQFTPTTPEVPQNRHEGHIVFIGADWSSWMCFEKEEGCFCFMAYNYGKDPSKWPKEKPEDL